MRGAAGFKDAIEIVFLLSDIEGDGRVQRLELELSKKTFRLGCSPVVNLFPQVAEPIQLNQRKYEYPVTPDVRRPYSMEIFSIDEVSAINATSQKITRYEPFYSLRHAARREDRACFWLARRRPSSRPNDEGTDISLSLIDLSTNAINPDAAVLSVRTTCTNRDLPSRLPFGNQDSDFEMEGAAAMKRIVALRKPTPPVRPALGKSTLWRLVSHLSLNYLSLVEQGKEALQEILRLYDVGRTAYSQNVIQSILQIRSRPHFTRLISEQGVSFARGMRIEMEIDEDQFTGGGAFLFANVLERFFGLSASLNSFTQLSVTTPQRKEGFTNGNRDRAETCSSEGFAAGREARRRSLHVWVFPGGDASAAAQRRLRACRRLFQSRRGVGAFSRQSAAGLSSQRDSEAGICRECSTGDDGELHGPHWPFRRRFLTPTAS